MSDRTLVLVPILVFGLSLSAGAQEPSDPPTTAERPDHLESAEQHVSPAAPDMEEPPLPDGMSLEDVLDRAASPPPETWPQPVPDDRPYVFTFIELLEYRVAADDTRDHLGWEAQGWAGGDRNKFWWKNEGEAVFEGNDEGETETDLLYARLITPFWSFQVGAQYANEWNGDGYADRWSGVIAMQGLAPYKFEIDSSLYVSEDGDATFEFEAEYDLRVTQRLVVQPLVGLGIAFQDVPERDLGSGLTDVNFDIRLRYEFRRELAPYVGIRYQTLVGDTEERAEMAGRDTGQMFVVGGLRFAF